MRIGHINYLNCLPLTYALTKGIDPSWEIVRDVPAKLNNAIINDKLDISPVSSIIYAQNADKLMILPDISIMADGDVQSIYLVSKKPIEQLTSDDTIILTKQSATSHCLLKIILNKAYHIMPNYEIQTVSPANIFPSEEASATLFIGDDALFVNYHRHNDLYYYDLGNEWKKFTGLCMVFAVWVVRKQIAQIHHDEVLHVENFIRRGFVQGFINRHEAITSLAKNKLFSYAQLDEYLHVIKWKLGNEQLKALSLFYRYAHELKLIDKIPPLTIFK